MFKLFPQKQMNIKASRYPGKKKTQVSRGHYCLIVMDYMAK
jgi:hypothetical protein